MSDRVTDPSGAREPAMTTLESTFPPTPFKDLLVDDGACILVLSHDAELASVLREAAGDQYPLRIVNEWSELLEHVRQRTGRIVLLDVDALERSLERSLIALGECADWLVIVVAAKQKQAQDFMRLWSERRIHRLLIKPAAIGISRLLLDSAVGRFVELRRLHKSDDDDVIEVPTRVTRPRPRPRRSYRGWLAVAGLLALAAIAGGYYRGMLPGALRPIASDPGEATAPPSADTSLETTGADAGAADSVGGQVAQNPSAPAASSAEEAAGDAEGAEPQEPALGDPFAERLALAEEARREGRLTEPSEANALAYYTSILADDPDHEGAAQGLAAVIERLYENAQSALLSGELAAAESDLEQIRRVSPDSTRLDFLQAQVVREREARVAESESIAAAEAAVAESRATAAAAQQVAEEAQEAASLAEQEALALAERAARADEEVAELEARLELPPSELESLIAVADVRFRQGAVLEPEGDSALDYVLRAVALDPTSSEVRDRQQVVAQALAEQARLLLADGELDEATTVAERAATLGADRELLAVLTVELTTARQQREARQQVEALARIDRLLDAGSTTTTRGESAYSSFLELRNRNPELAGLDAVGARLVRALAAEARAAIDRSDWPAVDMWMTRMLEIDADTPVIDAVRSSADYKRRQEAFLATASPIGVMEIAQAQAPEYPRNALVVGTQGWVDIELVVNTLGQPEAVAVADAEPEGVFEEAAVAAVEQYLFVPYREAGEVYARRLRVRIRFELD
jgi:TonB family protein